MEADSNVKVCIHASTSPRQRVPIEPVGIEYQFPGIIYEYAVWNPIRFVKCRVNMGLRDTHVVEQ